MDMRKPEYWTGFGRFALGLIGGFLPIIILLASTFVFGINGFIISVLILSVWARYDRQVIREERRKEKTDSQQQ